MIHPFLLHCFQKQLLLHCFLKTAFLCRFQKSIPLLSRFPYHGFTSQCNFLYPSITFGNMLQQQSATFLRHFLNRLFHYRWVCGKRFPKVTASCSYQFPLPYNLCIGDAMQGPAPIPRLYRYVLQGMAMLNAVYGNAICLSCCIGYR